MENRGDIAMDVYDSVSEKLGCDLIEFIRKTHEKNLDPNIVWTEDDREKENPFAMLTKEELETVNEYAMLLHDEYFGPLE